MINLSDVTKAIENLFKDNLSGYTVERNEIENLDENTASKEKGWIGIYKGSIDYSPERIGNNPWDAEIQIIVEIQCASFKSGKDAENKLEAAIKEILDLLEINLTLNGTVGMTNGYEVEYIYSKDDEKSLFLQTALIKIIAKSQT